VSGAYLKELEHFAGAATVEGPEWLEPIRRSAMDCFGQTGFPTAREEEWRFTPVTPLAQTSWHPAAGLSEEITRKQLAPFIFGHEE
jgi:Fe-S cluster assembly protein SufD